MATIDLTALLPVAGALSNADTAMTMFYDPVADSLGVINGGLNLDNKSAAWLIGRDQVRPGSMSGSQMVGLTGNLDYLNEVFPEDNTEPGAYVAIPGAAISFRLRFDAKLVAFTWQILGCNDSFFGAGTDEETELRFFINGVRQQGQFRVIPSSAEDMASPAPDVRHKDRERLWSGHWIRATGEDTTLLTAGWHDAYIGIFNHAPNARIRIRNIKYLYW